MSLMKEFRAQLMEDHFPNEAAISEDILRDIYAGIVFIAGKERAYSLGAVLFLSLSLEDKYDYFNKVILPMYTKRKYPRPNKEPYLKFQEDVKAKWRSIKQVKGVDYHDQAVVKKTLGL